jgi:phosphoinositide-3-kinase regulatory subunit 4
MASLPKLPPADAKVYHDYLLPSLSLLPNDSEELVRVGYALAVAHLAAAAHEHLLGMQFSSAQQQQYSSSSNLAAAEAAAAAAVTRVGSSRQLQQLESQNGSSRQAGSSTGGITAEDSPAAAAGGRASAGAEGTAVQLQQQQQPLVRYDAEMVAVRSAVEKVVLDLVTGTRSSADIKRGLLSHTHQLGLFFGRKDINNVLLPLLITCLNAAEWQLRGSFFGAIAAVGPHTGRDSLDVFLLPCLEQVSWLVSSGCC